MAKDRFLKRHGIVRSAIREDLLFFALPAMLVFCAGLLASALDAWNGLAVILGDPAKPPRILSLLSVQTIIGLALILLGYTILLISHYTRVCLQPGRFLDHVGPDPNLAHQDLD